MKTAVVTGATGVVGMALIDELYSREYKIYSVCRADSNRKERLLKQGKSTIIECDISRLENLPSQINEGVDVFYHLGWENTFGAKSRDDMYSQINNIRYCLDAVNVAKALGADVFIGAGSQAEYGIKDEKLSPSTTTEPQNGYGMAKLCAGQMSRVEAKKIGIKHIWVRILSVYGPFDGENTLISLAIRKMLKGEILECTKGIQLWDYIFSKDVAIALCQMAEKSVDKAVYCLGSGESKPLKYYIREIRDRIDNTLDIGFGKVPYVNNNIINLSVNIDRLRQDINFEPKYSFSEGIKETINWMEKEIKNESN